MVAPLPTENWPKPWMLQLHAEAVEKGFIWIEGITEGDAASLRLRFYRIRRRSDKSMAAFIPPEYHMVMMGAWELGPAGTGRVPVIYNKRPDGVPLPTIREATGEEIASLLPVARTVHTSPEINLDELDVKMKPGEIDDFVQKMKGKVKGGAEQ